MWASFVWFLKHIFDKFASSIGRGSLDPEQMVTVHRTLFDYATGVIVMYLGILMHLMEKYAHIMDDLTKFIGQLGVVLGTATVAVRFYNVIIEAYDKWRERVRKRKAKDEYDKNSST